MSMTVIEQRQIIADLVTDLEQMDVDGAIDLSCWPAAQAVVAAFRAGA